MTNSCQLRGFGEQVTVIIEEVLAKDLKESLERDPAYPAHGASMLTSPIAGIFTLRG